MMEGDWSSDVCSSDLCPAYQEKRSTLFEYLNKEYRISVNRMAPDDVFSVVNQPSEQEQTSAKVNCKIRIRLL